jgi:tRNA nucleotidyltransferase (CCA-adding enzyme)
VIFICWVASEGDSIRHWLELYHKELSTVTPLMDGEELRKMGLAPGPLYSQILGAVRDAKLDGRVSSLEEERAEVRRLIGRTQED